MKLSEYLRGIVLSEKLEDKLLDPKSITLFNYENLNIEEINSPGRKLNHRFSSVQYKFPKTSTFHLSEKRAEAIHFFANHELLAIEIMAYTLLKVPLPIESKEAIVSGLLGTILDEQKHFNMYMAQMKEFGLEFGELPVNDYFWRQALKVKSIEGYFSLMALTFEAANLDFCLFYSKVFEKVGDKKLAKLLEVVFEDEISHVSLGGYWLSKWKGEKSLWEYYLDNLPDQVTPSRSKGIEFNRDSRFRCQLPKLFIDTLENYRDPFKIVERKSNVENI